MLHIMSSRALHTAKATIVKLGQTIDNHLAARPSLALFDAPLEDEEALSISERIVGHLSDPNFSVTFDQLVCEELVLVSSSSPLVNPLASKSLIEPLYS